MTVKIVGDPHTLEKTLQVKYVKVTKSLENLTFELKL